MKAEDIVAEIEAQRRRLLMERAGTVVLYLGIKEFLEMQNHFPPYEFEFDDGKYFFRGIEVFEVNTNQPHIRMCHK